MKILAIRLTGGQSEALIQAGQYGLHRFHRGWAGSGVGIFDARTIERLRARDLVEVGESQVSITDHGRQVLADVFGIAP